MTMTGLGSAVDSLKETADSIKERVGPTLDALGDNVREARRAIASRRHAAEDFAAEAGLRVRRNPLGAVAVAAGAGAVIGCLFGFALGWWGHGRAEE